MSKQFEYVACPYCSHSIVVNKFRKTEFTIDPLKYNLLTVREQRSPKGYARTRKGVRGFFLVEGSGKNIIEMFNGTAEEREIAERIIQRIETIYRAYRKAGLVR